MGEFLLLDVLIFGIIAAFLVLRLFSVLGEKSDQEDPNPELRKLYEEFFDISPKSAEEEAYEAEYESLGDLPEGIYDIQQINPNFQAMPFLEGARSAFAMILEAFANGDKKTLKTLLSESVYKTFESDIIQREHLKFTKHTTIDDINVPEFVNVELDGSQAYITVLLKSKQLNYTLDQNGKLVQGDENQSFEHIDQWTFTKDIKSSDPNWLLFKTQVPHD